MIERLDHVALLTSDARKTAQFYSEWAGMSIIHDRQDPGSNHKVSWVRLERDEAGLIIVLVEVDEAEALLRQCKANKILLRHFGGALPDCVRISVGTPSQNDLLLKSFAALHGDWDGR